MANNGAVAVLEVATCQFPVSADVDVNRRCILSQLEAAARRGARCSGRPPQDAQHRIAGRDRERGRLLRGGRLALQAQDQAPGDASVAGGPLGEASQRSFRPPRPCRRPG
jgi:hypothetical protein